jgi:hypothetical protein
VQEQQLTEEKDSTLPSFVIQESVVGCDCIPVSERFAKAELRLDPTTRGYNWEKPIELLALLKSQSENTGSSVVVRNVGDCLTELASRAEPCPSDVMLLIHPNGHYYLLLGTVMIGDTLTYQVIHGDSPVWLIDKSSLENAKFAEVWQFKYDETKGVPVQIGETILELSSHYVNFGKVLPTTKLESVFYLKNTGSKSLILRKPEVSCRCTVTDDLADAELQSGESREFKVSFETSSGSSERHSVSVPIFEKGTGLSKKLNFELLASQQQSMGIDPLGVDFGNVDMGKKYTRTLNFTEVPTDRFSITKFLSTRKQLQGSFHTIGINQGLKTYQVEITFIPDSQKPDRTNDIVTIETNSILRPKVEVPFTYNLLPEIRAEPSSVALGSIAVGETVEAKIKIVSRSSGITKSETRSIPDGCNVEIIKQGNPTEVSIRFKPIKAGIWQDEILIAVNTSSCEEVLSIACFAYVH